jgi:SAM-dependent methyltransferase
MAQGGLLRRGWNRLSLYKLRKTRLTRKHLERLCREHATAQPTLVAHLEFDPAPYFPNAVMVAGRPDPRAHLQVDPQYRGLDDLASDSYEVILCSGLLEHIPDPQRLLDAFHRILRPGGKLILSASAVFSFHGCPHDYFHFTPYSLRLLLKQWRTLSIKGNSQPFETIGILLQRISLQCEMARPLRLLIELAAHLVPFFDRFIGQQYNRVLDARTEACRTDSMMPANLQVIAVK